MNLYDCVFPAPGGGLMSMGRVRHQPVLLVAFTLPSPRAHQIIALNRIHDDFRGGGLVVLGIPGLAEEVSDADQEPEAGPEYPIRFPLTAPLPMLGRGAHPLFHDLVERYGPVARIRGEFEKCLFDRKSRLVHFWKPEVVPDDPGLIRDLARHLQSWRL